MKRNMWLNLVLCVFLGAIIAGVGFVVLIIALLAGQVRYYAPLIVVVTLFLIVCAVLSIFELVKSKTRRKIFVSFLVLCVGATTGYELNRAYHRSFAEVNEQGVNLREYSPFVQESKAVTLDEPSMLKIDANLPRLDGATALYPLYAAFAQATYPEKEYNLYDSEVMINNTVEAYRNLINGRADLIFVAGPSDKQLDYAERSNVELVLTPIGREAFVFFVNTKNPVTGLTTEQIQNIYTGELTNWSEVGGTNHSIRAFQRPQDSGSQTALQRLMAGKELMTPPKEDRIGGMGGIIEETASYRNYKNAIGYSFRFFATEMVQNGQIRLLKVDGVYPNKETIRSNEYPLAAEFYAVTLASNENPQVEALIEWILSPQGQSLVEKTGYISLEDF